AGGERQRVCIARAFVKDAPILILDEPTASVDSKTEAVILEALDRLMEGRTTVMVAHRLSTIRHADLILVMNDGELIEMGTHQQLLDMRGLYRVLWEMQTGAFAPTTTGPLASAAVTPLHAVQPAGGAPAPEPVYEVAAANGNGSRPKVGKLAGEWATTVARGELTRWRARVRRR